MDDSFRMAARRFACFVALGLSGMAVARADVVLPYDVTNPFGASPDIQGWLPLNFTSATQGNLVNDALAEDGVAWQVSNPGNGAANPRYAIGLSQQLEETAMQFGWSISARARLAEDQFGSPSQGITGYFENRVFSVLVDLDTAGNLQANLLQAGPSFEIKQLAPASDAENYFDYELRYDPASNTASFYFDGQLVKEDFAGLGLQHEPLLQFGSGAILGQGTMNFTNAKATIFSSPGPTPAIQQGDFNDDGKVGADDYTLWRDTLGSTTQLNADANGNRQIDLGDYQVWKQNYGRQLGASSNSNAARTSAVPEPSSLAILAVWLVVITTGRAVSMRKSPKRGG